MFQFAIVERCLFSIVFLNIERHNLKKREISHHLGRIETLFIPAEQSSIQVSRSPDLGFTARTDYIWFFLSPPWVLSCNLNHIRNSPPTFEICLPPDEGFPISFFEIRFNRETHFFTSPGSWRRFSHSYRLSNEYLTISPCNPAPNIFALQNSIFSMAARGDWLSDLSP
jgi:hypothetical protein